MNRLVYLAIAVFLLYSPSAQVAQTRPVLRVTVEINSPSQGLVVLTPFDSADSFLETPFLILRKPVNMGAEVAFELNNLKSGTYAISAYYDRDNNNELNTNFFGIPKEQVGFSNNAKGSFGPPDFEDAAFDFSYSTAIQIELISL